MPPAKAKGREGRSRNGTPLSVDIPDHNDSSLSTSSPNATTNLQYADLLDQFCRGSNPPASATLKRIAESLKFCNQVAKSRSDKSDKDMRTVSRQKKDLAEAVREQEHLEMQAAEQRKEQLRQETLKREQEDSRPPAVGAHRVAAQDDSGSLQDPLAIGAANGPESSPVHVKGEAERSPDASADQQPRPAPRIPQVQTFGEDPSTFDDPTIYHIREVSDDMAEEEKKDVLNVAEYPHSDLHDLTPGTPPDRDFSNAKADHRVTQNQFSQYLEPYVRPLMQEDLTFLEERGDRTGAFIIPRRGPKHYREVWEEEDGNLSANGVQSPPRSGNQASGSMEQMNDDTAESGGISAGPMLSRLLSAFFPERRAPPTEQVNGVNGDSLTNGNAMQTDGDTSFDQQSEDQRNKPLVPAAQMAESNQPGWRTQQKIDYATADERVKSELRYIGFLSEDAEADYEGHHDDEVAARLRTLQEELRELSIKNGARKARVHEIAEEQMAKQEWSTIADDLDTQINQAYLKRHRNIGKGKKPPKRPGASGGGAQPTSTGLGLSKPSVSEPIRMLMDRRKEWNRVLAPLVEEGRTPILPETIFDDESMERLMAREREFWNEAQEQS